MQVQSVGKEKKNFVLQEKNRMTKKKALWTLAFVTLIGLFAVAFVVWFFDPFYQYHEPFFGWKAVLNDRDNQMAGTIHNFTYDSLLVGSSVAENFDSEYLDASYDCETLKVIRASGSMADLLYYVNMAEEEREIKNIFWCLDLFALDASTEVTLYGKDIPRYLHTKTVLDDLPYLYNKEILLEKIPAMIVSSIKGINTGGQAYNWSEGKNFSAEAAMHFYDKPDASVEVVLQDASEYENLVLDNLTLLEEQLVKHKEINFRFIFPPYSMMWWDCAWVNGQSDEKFYILNETLSRLTTYDNVEIYYYQSDEEIVCNLDNYMDMVHYAPEINQRMLEGMLSGEGRVTNANYMETIAGMKQLADRISATEIYRYYDKAESE